MSTDATAPAALAWAAALPDLGGCTAVLVAGPTASGKSALALALAETFGGEIVNADSMQVYAAVPVLTAQPDAADRARAPHHLYGTVPPAESYSVARWLGDAACTIADIRARQNVPIITGGTGLYFRALLQGLSPIPDIPPEVRQHWRQRAVAVGPAALHAELRVRDPATAARLRPSDPQRLTRALEVLDATGRSLTDWQREPGQPALDPATALCVVVSPERAVLRHRCDARFQQMLAAGALAEVAEFADQNIPADAPVRKALGLAPLLEHLAGHIPLETAADQAKAATRAYAKRQVTWCRRFMAAPGWTWLA